MAKANHKGTIASALVDKKYRSILAIIGAFFVLMIVVSLLTAFYTKKVDTALVESDLINKQLLMQSEIAANIYDMDLYLQNAIAQKGNQDSTVTIDDLPQDAINLLDSITTKNRILTEIVTASDRDGGEVTLEDGTKVVIEGFQSEYLHNYVKNIKSAWIPYEGLIEAFLKGTKTGQLSKETSEYMVAYSRIYNPKLSFEIRNLDTGIKYFIQQQSNKILAVQIAGSIIGFILLMMLIFGALRQLMENDKLLDDARQETTEILTTVNTGLFLLDNKLNIGNQYSHALESILGTKRLAGENLTTVLRNRISDKDLNVAKQFVDQLYNPRVKENLVNDLNPLNKILYRDEQTSKNRYLDFKFSRVYNSAKEIVHILVNVNDISDAVLLEQRLEKERAQNDLQLEMLATILNIQPHIMREFITNTTERINKINNILKNPGSSQNELDTKLRSIYREMHSLKGEASALKLHNFTKIAAEAEDKMQGLYGKPGLSGNDFLPLTVHLDELLTLSNLISQLGDRIAQAAGQLPSSKTAKKASLHDEAMSNISSVTEAAMSDLQTANYYRDFAQDIANRQNKKVRLDIQGSEYAQVPSELSSMIKEVSIQILRNAIAHGIEVPSDRVANGKDEVGTVSMRIKQDANQLVLSIKDDGRGIDYAAVRAKLVAQGHYTVEQAEALSESHLTNILFTSGFSTKDSVDEDSGRGVGLDVIKARVQEVRGKLNVTSKLDQGTLFTITLPKN